MQPKPIYNEIAYRSSSINILSFALLCSDKMQVAL